MPLQNRVAPDGTIFADAARGLLMGNRGGQLHDAEKRLTARRWASRQWITCALEYKDRHESIMAPGRYTQLFFLDEATALSAGHRPCALCRRADFVRFMEGWQRPHGFQRLPKVAEVDAALHAERVGRDKHKVTFDARLGDLPDGVMVELGAESRSPSLPPPAPPHPVPLPIGERGHKRHPLGSIVPSPLWGEGERAAGHSSPRLCLKGVLLPWSPSGYGPPLETDPAQTVRVLTPRSIVAIIVAGDYQPMLHPSARSRSAAKSA